MMSIDDEWNSFIDGGEIELNDAECYMGQSSADADVPVCDDLYISTKTKVLFLNQPIDIATVFWSLPIIEYGIPRDGIVKKQMKIVCNTPEEYEEYRHKLDNIKYFTENVIKQINNPTARRIKYKDERKITIGMSKKDIMNCRGKVKNAFYNCFAIIIRFNFEGVYREIHIKVFNTGKLEIPGILNIKILSTVKDKLLELLSPYIKNPCFYVDTEKEDNVLINSNFNCGYYINRDRLYSILRGNKYRIETAYDPCSYPGVKCKFYFNTEFGFDKTKQTGQPVKADRTLKMSELCDAKQYIEISFMIFRTGSCLIVGNCTENILYYVFDFIKQILRDEYHEVRVETDNALVREKKTKLRKKQISMTLEYYNNHIMSRGS